jgi:hypothetical protein
MLRILDAVEMVYLASAEEVGGSPKVATCQIDADALETQPKRHCEIKAAA